MMGLLHVRQVRPHRPGPSLLSGACLYYCGFLMFPLCQR